MGIILLSRRASFHTFLDLQNGYYLCQWFDVVFLSILESRLSPIEHACRDFVLHFGLASWHSSLTFGTTLWPLIASASRIYPV